MTAARSGIVACLCLWSSLATAQSPAGTIGGVVEDAAGKPIANAAVEVVRDATALRRSAVSAGDGRFVLPQLPPGEYTFQASAKGFLPQKRSLTVAVHQELDLHVVLPAEGKTERVEVRDTAPLLTMDSTVGGSIPNRQIVELPLEGRNYYDLALLLPGVAPPAQGSAGSRRGDFAISVNGAREESNQFLLDGAYNGDPKLNGSGVTSPVDAIREFTVQAATYDATFGRNSGAQVSVAVKSGTNAVHGTAYEFFRNAAMDARNYFAPAAEPDPRYQRNQFGGSLGLPIAKNRLFLFAAYERRMDNIGVSKLTNVPGAAERTGDFSASPFPVFNPITQQPFPGNVIPSYFISPIGRNIANLYPLPNRNVLGQNYAASPIGRDRSNGVDGRLDAKLTASDDLVARYSFGQRSLYEPFTGPSFPQFPGYGDSVARRATNALLAETHVFSPNKINEVRLVYNRVATGVYQQNQAVNLNAQVGLPTVSTNTRDWGLSMISLLGYSPIGDEYNNPQSGAANTWQLADQFTWTRGGTVFKFGGEFRDLRQNGYRDVQSRGFLNFTGLTGNSLSDLLLGFPTITGVAKLDNAQHLRGQSYNTFAQASWRVRPKFTLELGLRYEYNTAPVDPQDRASLYDPATGKLVRVGTNGMPRGGYPSDGNNLAPRAGFAWQLATDTVLRGGYGLYYDQSQLAPSEGLYFSQPFYNFNLFFPLPGLPLMIDNPWPAFFPYPLPSSAFSIQPNLRTPYVQQWSMQVQRAFGTTRVLEAGYVGTKGTKLHSARDINQPAASTQVPNLRPNPMFDDINQLGSVGNSVFHSFQASFRQQWSRGFSMLAAYTLGKSIDEASNFFPFTGDSSFPQDSNNLRAERGLSAFDMRQRFVMSYSWSIPSPKAGAARAVLGGWSTYGIWTFQSGRPFTVALAQEIDRSNTGRSSLGFGANDRPNVLGPAALANPTPERWFDTSAFVLQPFGTFGNAGRNILTGPGLATVNVSLHKNFAVTERTSVQFRAEAFNVLNHTNFDLPQNFLGGAGFGSITSAQNPRVLQLGLKLIF